MDLEFIISIRQFRKGLLERLLFEEGLEAIREALTWLENQSFSKDTADVLIGLQKDQLSSTQALQQDRLSDDEGSSASSVIQDDPAVLKRRREDKDENRDKKSKKKKKKHKKKHKRKHETEEKDYKESLFKPDLSKVFIDDIPGLSTEDAFRADRSCDTNNWTYGSLYKLHVGKYYRLGYNCLGLGMRQHVDLSDSSKKSKKLQTHNQGRYFAKDSVKSLKLTGNSVQTDPTNNLGNTCHSDYTVPEFLSLDHRESKVLYTVIDDNVNPLGVYDSATCSYLQGQRTKASDNETKGSDIPPDKDSGTETSNSVADYNRKLREHPHDINLWLEFVKFQDAYSSNTGLTPSYLSGKPLEKLKTASVHVVEKKLAILVKAIKANPGSVELKIAHLDLSGEVKEAQEISAEWEQLLFIHSGNTSLWRHYLLFVQSNLGTFTVSKTVKKYQTCLQKLWTIITGDIQLVDKNRPYDEDVLLIFYLYCSFLKQTGHTEKAVASFQALLEFNLFSPSSVQGIPHAEKLAVFEGFWDSGVARFGENGAQGWAYHVQNKEATPSASMHEELKEEAEETILGKEQPIWKTWLEMENYRESIHQLPWQPDISQNQTEDDCEDPDRLVLVDDITPVLFSLNNKELHYTMVILFLLFLGVDVDSYYSSFLLRDLKLSQLLFQQTGDVESYKVLDFGFCRDRSGFAENLTVFVRNIFKQALGLYSGDKKTTLTLLYVEFEFTLMKQKSNNSNPSKQQVKELRNCVKNLLKEPDNRNNLTLWDQYARLEQSLGKPGDGLAVLETALSMQPGNVLAEDNTDLDLQLGVCMLYHSYARIALGLNDLDGFKMGHKDTAVTPETCNKVVSALNSLCDGSKFDKTRTFPENLSPTTILRTRNKFAGFIDQLVRKLKTIQSDEHERIMLRNLGVVVTSCSALYEYCTSHIDNASQKFQSVVDICHTYTSIAPHASQWPQFKFLLYKRWLELVIFHLRRAIYPLSKLQSVLDSVLCVYPEDRYFLQVFVDVETQSFISGRLRRYFDRAIRASTTPLPTTFAALAEIARHIALIREKTADLPFRGVLSDAKVQTGVVHKLRSLLERGLQSSHSQHCVLLWRLYMHFEMKYGDPTRSKGLFYRALQQCPWSKILYKDAVSLFPDQLQELVDLMMEKEIRVQIPVEEIYILKGVEPEVKPDTGPGELYTQILGNVQDED